jgi:nucleotide-binding universal stress UspA family protein
MVYGEVGAWSGRAHPRGAVVVGYNGKKPQPHRLGVGCPSSGATRRAAARAVRRVVGALRGSVAFAVAARAGCPVIVVKEEAMDLLVGPKHPVVIGTDGSAEAAAAVGFAADRAATASTALEVITCTGGHQVEDVDERELRASANRIAEAAADRLRETHPELPVMTRVEDCPAELTLVDASADTGLVVVGTRGRGAFEGMLLGSVSHAVIHGARCAVAVVGGQR